VPSNEPIDFVEEIEQHKRKHGPHRISLSEEEARKEKIGEKETDGRRRENKIFTSKHFPT
jgi:hypothetical protein